MKLSHQVREIYYSHRAGWLPLYSNGNKIVEVGTMIEGPAVIYNPFTSIVINPGWIAKLENEHLIISFQGEDMDDTEKKNIEAVEIGLVHESGLSL